jgi:tetratricopeptide (TPR) repeat protein
LYRVKAKYEKSLELLEQALEFAKRLGNARLESRCYNSLGNVYFALNHHDDAIAYYRLAMARDPLFPNPYNRLGNAFRVLGRHDDAFHAYQDAIELEPKEAYPHKGLGNIYTDLGRYDDAIAEFQRAIGLNPKLAMAYSSLAACYRKLGRETEYTEQIKIARELITNEQEYNRACFESVSGNLNEALALLKVALEKKQVSPAWARRDPDFDFIRDDPRFKALLGA